LIVGKTGKVPPTREVRIFERKKQREKDKAKCCKRRMRGGK